VLVHMVSIGHRKKKIHRYLTLDLSSACVELRSYLFELAVLRHPDLKRYKELGLY